MGYSIAVRVKSKTLRDQMYQFLQVNYHKPSEVFKELGYDSSRLVLDGNMAYDSGKCSIGFNYSCMDEAENQYVYCVLYWIALKVGKRRPFNKLGASVPYIVYDGYEAWPRLLRSEWESKVPAEFKWCLVEGCGFKSCRREGHGRKFYEAIAAMLGRSFKKQDKMVQEELQRLDRLWNSGERNSTYGGPRWKTHW